MAGHDGEHRHDRARTAWTDSRTAGWPACRPAGLRFGLSLRLLVLTVCS